ncbi:MAG: hypothetical protein ABW133_19955 [Polyangiaceae bacterium]
MHEIQDGLGRQILRAAPPPYARSAFAVIALLAAIGCSKEGGDKSAPSASASGSPASASASAAPAASATAKAVSGESAWGGSYTAKVGPVAPPDNAKEKMWADDPGSAAVGKGTVALNVSGARGDTRGELGGPLGDLQVSGVFDGKELRANLTPKDPKADTAMTGFMVLTGEGTPPAALKGTLRVSSRDARIVREANVELAKK